MPATTSQRAQTSTANTEKSEPKALKADVFNAEVFSAEMLKAVESALKGKDSQILDQASSNRQATSQNDDTSPASPELKEARSKQAPAQRMVQTADQWRNCSKPHRI